MHLKCYTHNFPALCSVYPSVFKISLIFFLLFTPRVDLWHVTKNLEERLSKIDQARLVAVDMVNVVTQHFERIRQAQSSA
jgi:hypothetical protein